MISTMTIDLSTQPDMRWNLTPQDKADLNTLLDDYLQDLSVDDSLLDLIQAEYIQNVPQEYRTEIEALADIAQRPLVELVVANLYYDLVKLVLGCTAFVAATPSGPIHGRNLDWFSNQRRLSRTTRQLNFINNPAGDFSIVGWPGAIGALSGIAYGRFSITLNAVASDESCPLLC
ncbi:hypothetical protein [Pleionea sp. CnH1-48]|uniref:hypothetical protein n=1 Tax=Pleionea sp. CnH1-48 TaxID=2954494 RepID=UPI0020969888|nr:hypothetical protein [Pleionea sp. CnH1-48]MCO7223130.1 hypothetical protein [Pleionea sp. CnH1-48]